MEIGWIVLEGSRLWYAQFDGVGDVTLLANAIVGKVMLGPQSHQVVGEYQGAPSAMQLGREVVVAIESVVVFVDCGIVVL